MKTREELEAEIRLLHARQARILEIIRENVEIVQAHRNNEPIPDELIAGHCRRVTEIAEDRLT